MSPLGDEELIAKKKDGFVPRKTHQPKRRRPDTKKKWQLLKPRKLTPKKPPIVTDLDDSKNHGKKNLQKGAW